MGYLSVKICFSFAFHKLSVIDNLMGRQKYGKGKSNGCNESESLKKINKVVHIIIELSKYCYLRWQPSEWWLSLWAIGKNEF